MLEAWRMAATALVRLAPKCSYMPAETTTGKPPNSKSIISIADNDLVTSGHILSRDFVVIREQTPKKVGDVGTKRNEVEEY